MIRSKQIIFPPFRLDPANQRLWRGGRSLSLRPKTFAVLQYLAERPGRLVTKEELLDAIWPDTHVTDTVLKVCIREIRDALGDKAGEPRFIETAHRRGYRFIAQLSGDNLPAQLTSFIGRDREIEEVKRLLSDAGLLTLTGAGGSGKTRLAMQVAASMADEIEDGVCWVELAVLSNPSLVPQAVASALGVREQPGRDLTDTLLEYLRPKNPALVLDNCEHLIEACAALAEALMSGCSRLKILATSREAMGIAGEVAWLVPPLSLPDPEDLPPVEEMVGYEAVRLFVERAEAARPSFALTDGNAGVVAQICRRLDGLPLAIELAAARVKMLTVEQIAVRLDDCFHLLTGGGRTALPRHQTLRAAIDWSYDLLSREERILLCRLSVFAGGFTLEAAEAVCADNGIDAGEILDLLSHLIDKSLVLVAESNRGGRARYRLLEIMRQYGQDRLTETGEASSTEGRHARFYLGLAEEAELHLNNAYRIKWLDLLDAEHANMQAALAWSRTGDGDSSTGLRMAGALWWFWFHRGYWAEGRGWLDATLNQQDASPINENSHAAKALFGLGVLTWTQGDDRSACDHLEKSMRIWRGLEDRSQLGYPMTFLSQVLVGQGEIALARSFADECLELFRDGEDLWGLGISLNNLGNVVRVQSDYRLARSVYEESVEIMRGIGDGWALSMALRNLGKLAFKEGDYDRAIELHCESLAWLRTLGEKWFVTRGLEELAAAVCSQGDCARAARLLGAAEALRETLGATVLPMYLDEYDQTLSSVRDRLSEKDFRSAWSEGRAMTQEKAIAYALGEFEENQ